MLCFLYASRVLQIQNELRKKAERNDGKYDTITTSFQTRKHSMHIYLPHTDVNAFKIAYNDDSLKLAAPTQNNSTHDS